MVIVIVLIAVVLIAFCNISIRIMNAPDKASTLILRASYLFVYLRKEIHAEKDEEESVAFTEYKRNGKKKKLTGLRSLYLLYRKYKGLPLSQQEKWNRAIRYIVKRVRVDIERLRLSLGLNDAVLTSIAAGFALVFLNSVIALSGKFKSGKEGKVKVFPAYNREVFQVDLDCIIHIKPVHIIIGYFKFLLKRR